MTQLFNEAFTLTIFLNKRHQKSKTKTIKQFTTLRISSAFPFATYQPSILISVTCGDHEFGVGGREEVGPSSGMMLQRMWKAELGTTAWPMAVGVCVLYR